MINATAAIGTDKLGEIPTCCVAREIAANSVTMVRKLTNRRSKSEKRPHHFPKRS
jgi:hypothetical protein